MKPLRRLKQICFQKRGKVNSGIVIWGKDPQGQCIAIVGRECLITLEPRPHYCDRGNWIAKLFPTGTLARDIDEADGWPRYYFDEDRAKAEIEAWLIRRGQVV